MRKNQYFHRTLIMYNSDDNIIHILYLVEKWIRFIIIVITIFSE